MATFDKPNTMTTVAPTWQQTLLHATTVSDLRASPKPSTFDVSIFVDENGGTYQWEPSSTAVDDGTSTSIAIGTSSGGDGRWLILVQSPAVLPNSAFNEFVFRPNEPAPSGNVFAAWAPLVSAAQKQIGPKTVFIDTRLGAATIPAGAWDFQSPTTLMGLISTRVGDGSGAQATPLAIASGATLINVFEFVDVVMTSNSAINTGTINAPLQNTTYVFRGGAAVIQAGAGAFILSAGAFTTCLWLADFGAFRSGICYRNTSATGVLAVEVFDGAAVLNNTLVGVAGGTYLGIENGPGGAISTTQPSLSGGITIILTAQASAVAYTDTAPLLNASTVQAAIDAIKLLTNKETFRFSDIGLVVIGTRFLAINGVAQVAAASVQLPVLRASSYTTIRIDASAAPGATHSTVYTVQKNGVDTAITVTLGAAQTTNTATVAAVAYAANDFISVKQVPDGAGNVTADPRVTVS